jgi:hypothetical protein
LFDGNGLYLLIKPNDSKWWRVDYSINQKRKTLSLGTYPVTTLADARKKAFELKKLVAEGVDPSQVRKVTKEEITKVQVEKERIANGLPPIDSFKHVADEWYLKKMQHMAESYKGRVYSRLERDVFPFVGNKHIAEITSQELLKIIRALRNLGNEALASEG